MVHFVNMRPELGAKYFIDPILASLQAFYLDPESNAEMQHAAAILAMMNEFGDALLKDTRQVLQFVKSMLIDSEHEGIALALTLLKEIFSAVVSVFAASLDLDDDAQRVIADIRIILQTLTQHPDEDIRAASREIRAAMAARLAPANVGPSSSQDTLSSTAQDAAAMAAEKKARDQFREALKNLGDELLPVRAFGMSVLRQLVLDRSAVARENLESIISIFLDLVEDEDSFIYLNAVKGLSALTDVYAPQTLSRIAKRYMDKESLTLDYRVRIGEALMQTIHRSGQVFPKHGK
nr:transmembrane and coiled-coil domains-containing protein 7 [Polyrhizophydium stewartii]